MIRNSNTDQPQPDEPTLPPTRPNDPIQPDPSKPAPLPLPPDIDPPAPVREPDAPQPAGDPRPAEPTRIM